MKQKDIILIGAVVVITAVISYFGSNALFGGPKKHNTKVEVVEQIDADFTQPDQRYFNANSIDPTRLIQIGNNDNTQPFNKGQ
jgi:hypothetical protein